jgi:phospholipid/cholesterol/gamma-HCH transport system substrate-binding protein
MWGLKTMPQKLRVGLFVVVSLLLFGAGIFLIGRRDFRFSSTYRLNTEFQSVAGLDEGATVRVGGIHQGTVRKIVLPQRPDQKIRVEMDLNQLTRKVIKKDSLAAIRTEGLVGDQYVEIGFGSPNAPGVQNGDTIGSEPPLEISEMMKKTNAILDGAKDAVQSVDEAAGNLEAISSKVNRGQGTAGALINDRAVYEHIDEATRNLKDDTEALKHNFLLRGFFKKRGYENEKELKEHSIAEAPAVSPTRGFAYSGKKLFDKPDGAKMKNSKMLDEAGRFLESSGQGLVVIGAFADMKGDSDKQRELTQARAAVVRDYLVQHFKISDDSRIRTMAFGKSQDTAEGGEIKILVYPPGTKVPKPASGTKK